MDGLEKVAINEEEEFKRRPRSFSKDAFLKGSFCNVGEDVRLYYETYGGGPHKILLIPGFAARLATWQLLVDHLLQYPDYEVVAFDLRGVGRSVAPVGKYTTSLLASDALALLEHLQWDRVHVIGASIGGMVAQELALLAPTKVVSLLLSTTSAGSYVRVPLGAKVKGYEPFLARCYDPDTDTAISLLVSNVYSQEWLNTTNDDGTTNEQQAREFWQKHFGEWLDLRIEAINSFFNAAQTHYVSGARLAQIRNTGIHITVHICSDDKLLSAKKQYNLQKALEADALVFRGSGHFGWLEYPSRWFEGVRAHLKRAIRVLEERPEVPIPPPLPSQPTEEKEEGKEEGTEEKGKEAGEQVATTSKWFPKGMGMGGWKTKWTSTSQEAKHTTETSKDDDEVKEEGEQKDNNNTNEQTRGARMSAWFKGVGTNLKGSIQSFSAARNAAASSASTEEGGKAEHEQEQEGEQEKELQETQQDTKKVSPTNTNHQQPQRALSFSSDDGESDSSDSSDMEDSAI
ncbi:AB hydrolase-1 domain-containing protein [Balamuthia mandrillaris]